MTITSFSHRRIRGQAGLEFFFALIVFIVMFLALGDLVRISYNWVGMQYSSNRGIRVGKTLPNSGITDQDRVNAVQNEVITRAASIGISLTNTNVNVTINGAELTVETQKDVTLGPVTGLILKFGGDHSGTYTLKVREAIRNESL